MKNRILLIEDDVETIDLYKLNLEKAGFKLEIIKWGKEALERVEKIGTIGDQKPDLILLDIILPDINGIHVLEKIRDKKENFKEIKIAGYAPAVFIEILSFNSLQPGVSFFLSCRF